MGRTTSEPGRTRRRWSEEEKRAIVTEALVPGASIAAVARRYAFNTNLLHGWRRLYGSPIHPPAEPVLLPVDITKAAQAEQSIEGASRRASKPGGLIETAKLNKIDPQAWLTTVPVALVLPFEAEVGMGVGNWMSPSTPYVRR